MVAPHAPQPSQVLDCRKNDLPVAMRRFENLFAASLRNSVGINLLNARTAPKVASRYETPLAMSRDEVLNTTFPPVAHPSPSRYPRRNANLQWLSDIEYQIGNSFAKRVNTVKAKDMLPCQGRDAIQKL
jgi:hypothetical protein